MTYIEFFDRTAIENVCICLTDVPERVIIIGNDMKELNRHIANYKRVFADRGYDIEFIPRTASKSNLANAVRLLSDIVETYDDCAFDITGGEKILTLALGIVYEQYKDKNIQIHRMNIHNNAISDCDKDGNTVFKDSPMLTVDENIIIYGGDVRYGDIHEESATYAWNMTPDFEDDIEEIWSICKYNVRQWNIQIGEFEAIEKVGTTSRDSLTVRADVAKVNRYLSRYGAELDVRNNTVKKLLAAGLITNLDADDDTVEITYKNEQVKKCLTKAGQALEMKVYLTALYLEDKEGKLIYNDVLNGVVIDWDGDFHDEYEKAYDTENEIDIMLMHGIVPVFVSCKNGKVSVEELYKLNTVAERFGGKYAKKVLLASSLEMSGDSAHYIKQRAADMNITLIDNINEMSDKELAEELDSLWC